MQKIKSLLTFVLCLFAMTARADSGTTTFVRLDDVTQLKPYQSFIIVSYLEFYDHAPRQYRALSVRHNDCDHASEPVNIGSDGKIVISNDLLDNSTVNSSQITGNSPRKICVMRAMDIQPRTATSIKALIRMGSFTDYDAFYSFLDADYGLSFRQSGESSLCRWVISTDAYNDYRTLSGVFSEQLPTYGCILHADKNLFMTNYQNLELNPNWNSMDSHEDQYLDTRTFTTNAAFPISPEQQAYDNGISEETINGTKTRCYTSRIFIYVKEDAVCEHFLIPVAETQATCKANGRQAHYHCLVCSHKFYDDHGTREVANDADLNTPIGAHQPKLVEGWEPNCWSEGRSDYYECNVCHKYFAEETCQHELSNPNEDCYVEALGHDMKYVEGTNPTCTQPGIKGYYHCDRCSNDFADFEGTQYIERGQYPINPSLGHEYAEGSNTCSHCGHKAEAYYQAYNYGRVMEDGNCIFVAKIDGKYYTVGNLVNVPSPLEDPRGGRGRGEANTITAYEAIEVTPEADGSIMSSISGLQEFGRELLTPAELQDRFGGWHEGIPAALTLRTNDGYLMEQRRGSNSFGSERDPWQALEVFMPGTWMPEYYYPAQIKAMPLYTTVFQFEHVSVFRFVTVGGRLYFTAEHPSLLYEGYNPYNESASVCPPEYSYYVYTLTPDTPPTSTTPGAPNPYFNGDLSDDGTIDAQDIEALAEYISGYLTPAQKVALDFDGDGNVSVGDLVNYIKLVTGGSGSSRR